MKNTDYSLNSGFPVDLQDDKGNTLLLIGAQNCNRKLMELVLARGANINHQNGQGMTELHITLQFSNVEIAKLLLERGADKDLRDNDGDGVDYYVNAAKHSQVELRALLARY